MALRSGVKFESLPLRQRASKRPFPEEKRRLTNLALASIFRLLIRIFSPPKIAAT